MKKSKFTEAQIVFTLKQAETGVSVQEVCRKMGVSEATFYNVNWFLSLEDAQEKIEHWRREYNNFRSHTNTERGR